MIFIEVYSGGRIRARPSPCVTGWRVVFENGRVVNGTCVEHPMMSDPVALPMLAVIRALRTVLSLTPVGTKPDVTVTTANQWLERMYREEAKFVAEADHLKILDREVKVYLRKMGKVKFVLAPKTKISTKYLCAGRWQDAMKRFVEWSADKKNWDDTDLVKIAKRTAKQIREA